MHNLDGRIRCYFCPFILNCLYELTHNLIKTNRKLVAKGLFTPVNTTLWLKYKNYQASPFPQCYIFERSISLKCTKTRPCASLSKNTPLYVSKYLVYVAEKMNLCCLFDRREIERKPVEAPVLQSIQEVEQVITEFWREVDFCQGPFQSYVSVLFLSFLLYFYFAVLLKSKFYLRWGPN